MERANRYLASISTRHPSLIEVMEALKGTRRRSQFLTSCVELFLATEEGKKAARQVMESVGKTSSTATKPAESKNVSKLGFDLDSLLS